MTYRIPFTTDEAALHRAIGICALRVQVLLVGS
jgi:hypothetical protein